MTASDRIAVLSDIHGNLPALEAVLADIERREIECMVNLGDSLYGPLEPGQTAHVLMELDIPTVRGNEDRIIIFPPEDSAGSPSLAYTTRQLTADQILWLTKLPITAVGFDKCFMFHGTPERDDRYFLADVTRHGLELRSADDLETEVVDIRQPVILCGHDHTPRIYHLPDGRLIVNPGSVGLQAYSDNHPYAHVVETGSPHARYAILESEDGHWKAEIVQITYDWDRAAELAVAHGRNDWARWLQSGRVSHE